MVLNRLARLVFMSRGPLRLAGAWALATIRATTKRDASNPDPTEEQRERIRFLGEQLDAHRKRVQEAYPAIIMTEMYNVLEELRSGEPLGDASRIVHDRALISVLRDLHDDLDRAAGRGIRMAGRIFRQKMSSASWS